MIVRFGSAVTQFGLRMVANITGFGRYTMLVGNFFYWVSRRPFRARLLFRQLEFVGNKSFGIIFLAALFTGAVIGLQVGKIFGIFKAEGLMGATTGKAMALELGPVMCGFIVTGRAGAAMAAEIGTMRVNEQIDAMEAMGVDPVSYLVVPRVVASTIMMPILATIFLFLGVIGSYILGVIFFHIDTAIFMENVRWLVWSSDIRKGLFKAAVFGFILASIACFKGFYARGGAKGVGEATTEAVVASLLSILISDFFITYIQMR
jgi:phospholipid/cholesterol/gamma-HCH transport system permease protein